MTDYTRTNRSTVVGVFDNRTDADRAVEDLRNAGFRDDQIGILAHGDQTRTSGTAAGDTDKGAHVGEGAAAGVVAGGLLGAAAALLIPGIGPIVAGGILAGVVGSAVVGGAVVGGVAGGIVGALAGLGVPNEEAQYYEGEFRGGRTLVTVRADGRYTEAQAILRRDNAYDIENRPTGQTLAGTEGRLTTGGQMSPPASRTTSAGTTTGTAAGVAAGTAAGMSARTTTSATSMGTNAPSTTSWSDVMPTYRSQWQSRYATSGGNWETVSPYYQYGYQAYNDPRFRGRDWSTVEPDLQRDWEATHPNTPWATVRQYVIDIWNGNARPM